MVDYFQQFIAGIDQQARENDGVVEMSNWFHSLAFDVNPHRVYF